MDIFRGMFLLLFGSFDKVPQGQLLKSNWRNTVIALTTPVLSHKGLKDAKSFAKSCPS